MNVLDATLQWKLFLLRKHIMQEIADSVNQLGSEYLKLFFPGGNWNFRLSYDFFSFANITC